MGAHSWNMPLAKNVNVAESALGKKAERFLFGSFSILRSTSFFSFVSGEDEAPSSADNSVSEN